MSRIALAALALVPLLSACETADDAPPASPAADMTAAPDAPVAGVPSALENRLWARTDTAAAPGSVVVFFSDHTVFQTSCVEVYRLDPWRADGDGRVVMAEDGADIPTAYAVAADALTLTKSLGGGETVEEHYRPASAPILCPDMR